MDIGPFLLLMLLYAKLDGTTVDPSPLRSSKQGFLPHIRKQLERRRPVLPFKIEQGDVRT